ncbi:MAG: TrmH family RNA methyltransferase [Pseudomonadota bacterium]|nr:TrmH family RNA methyltransferase [Pseudomonadota bacterium]
MKNKFGFILIKPQLGENIGSTARILKNFGFSQLDIIEPRDGWPNQKGISTAVSASEIVKKAKLFKSTADAIKNYDMIFAFSARKRDITKNHYNIDHFIKKIQSIKRLNIGLMFGPESSGLSNQDLSFADCIVTIPTSTKFKSLNLSHSISIISYELFRSFQNNKKNNFKKIQIAKKKEIYILINRLIKLLESKDFFSPKEKKNKLIRNINDLFYRIGLSGKEIRILASIFGSLYKKKHKL